jgi:hypothetical protein
MNRIIRTICVFADAVTQHEVDLLNTITDLLQHNHFTVQTRRICLSRYHAEVDEELINEHKLMVGFGSLSRTEFAKIFPHFLTTHQKRLTLNLTHGEISRDDIEPLFAMIRQRPESTFGFAFGFNLPVSSPFFPSATFGQRGFSIGLQATDLAEGSQTREAWFSAMKTTWDELDRLLSPFQEYLGIDSSVAPLHSGPSSLIHYVRQLGLSFSHSTTTDFYTSISSFIKTHNPRPIGLCGLMFPCLEDFELAEEYEGGNFSIERNLFLSLHCGLGIDTYPIGIDQEQGRVLEIARLTQQLSKRFHKPLTIRLVSDGKATIGMRSNYGNTYLKDVIIRPL